jgi:hypothetical protein
MRTGGKSSIRFAGSERILTIDVLSTDWQNVASIAIQPGLITTFPWFAALANSFEKYKIHSLTAVYHNLVGTQTEGNVLMSFDYDVMDTAPTSAELASQSTHWSDGAPWRSFSLRIPTDNRTLFTRATDIVNGDPKTYDMGRLDICTEGVTPRPSLGYVELRYDITLLEKQPNALIHNTTPPTNFHDAYVSFTDPVEDPVAGWGYDTARILQNTQGNDFEIATTTGVDVPTKLLKGFLEDHEYFVTADTEVDNPGVSTSNVWSYVQTGAADAMEFLYDYALRFNTDGTPLISVSDATSLVADASTAFYPRMLKELADVNFGDMLFHIVDLGLSLFAGTEEFKAQKASRILKNENAALSGQIIRKSGKVESDPKVILAARLEAKEE